jgi:hypothetical protein
VVVSLTRMSLPCRALAGGRPRPSPSPAAPPLPAVLSHRRRRRPRASPRPIPVTALVGSWGVASFREDRDRPRTEAMARQHCRLPYVITKGPTDGVMMHVADDAKLYELTLKGSADGKVYLGFDAPPGHPQDRQILSLDREPHRHALRRARRPCPLRHLRLRALPGGGAATAAR